VLMSVTINVACQRSRLASAVSTDSIRQAGPISREMQSGIFGVGAETGARARAGEAGGAGGVIKTESTTCVV
jgi:hypothetical protein